MNTKVYPTTCEVVERFYDVLLSSEGNLEFVLPHTTKGTAVEALAKHWGLSPDEVMTLGTAKTTYLCYALRALACHGQ